MKKFMISCCIFFLCALCIGCKQTITVNDIDKSLYLQRFDLKEIVYGVSNAKDDLIITFDVSKQENVAVGLKNNTVLIYNKYGTLEKAFCFNGLESRYYVHWEEESIEIIFYRSKMTFVITSSGTVSNIYIKDLSAATNEQLAGIMNRSSVTVDNNQYFLEKTTFLLKILGGDYYDQLSKVDSLDQEETIYSSSTKLPVDRAWIFITIIFIAAGILTLIMFVPKKDPPSNKKHWTRKTMWDVIQEHRENDRRF